jgi:hypothetical protein
MFAFLTRLRKGAQPKQAKPQRLIGDYAVCERPSPTEWTPRHLRTVSSDPTSERGQLHTGGGLGHRDIVALCGAELAWDIRMTTRGELIEVVANKHSTVRYCEDCLDFAGIQLVY